MLFQILEDNRLSTSNYVLLFIGVTILNLITFTSLIPFVD